MSWAELRIFLEMRTAISRPMTMAMARARIGKMKLPFTRTLAMQWRRNKLLLRRTRPRQQPLKRRRRWKDTAPARFFNT